MITAPSHLVAPKIDLASLALCKTNNPEEASKSPTVGATDSTGLGTIDGAAVSGPMLPPLSGDANSTTPGDQAATSGDTDSPASVDSVMGGGAVEPITPADSVMNDDSGAQANGTAETTKGDGNNVPAAPTRPPPVPPRPEQQPEKKPAPQSKPKLPSLEESARQQDAAEVMGNIFDLIRCAIKGDEVLRQGEQGDAVKKIFFGDVMRERRRSMNLATISWYLPVIAIAHSTPSWTMNLGSMSKKVVRAHGTTTSRMLHPFRS
jgi:ubiquitin carboxyl-terminal hydrolase 25/28